MKRSTRRTKKINRRSIVMLALLALFVGTMPTMLVGCSKEHSEIRHKARVEARTKARTEDRIEQRRN